MKCTTTNRVRAAKFPDYPAVKPGSFRGDGIN
jgi:hypothetical protein